MKLITVQPGTDLTNPWTAGFIEVAEGWEQFALANGLEISGSLSPFIVQLEVKGRFQNFEKLHIEIRRKLENVLSGITPKRAPYSAIITLKGHLASAKPGARIKWKRSGVFNRFLGLFNGLQLAYSDDNILVYKDELKTDFFVKPQDLKLLSKMYSLHLNDRQVDLRYLAIPTSPPDIAQWFEAIDRVHTGA